MARSELSQRYNEFHALLVQTAKHYCLKAAPLLPALPSAPAAAAGSTAALRRCEYQIGTQISIGFDIQVYVLAFLCHPINRPVVRPHDGWFPWGGRMPANRVLFVDDESSLRLTFPAILRMHGFDVRSAATVAQALMEMTTRTFDILISDLNIGQPGDGFTVVSAMRRTQPDCINFILTGFPAFESALQAIQSQVDDFLIKPANIEELVELIQQKLRNRQPCQSSAPMRLSKLLRANVEEIRESAICKMKSDPALGPVPLSDAERGGELHAMILEIANQLDSAAPEQLTGRPSN